ncbi:reprolysin-like metallopeptidase [Lutibacter flavus]|uniref:Por secretion system C-terminal sorting domain-containing protein n=1 Tax=Lutibacter flavus TaxID=691689 RepID=A0A238X5B5_9FLAO|nr:zinc-dependent metalloprotease family protein [Lutibacter flavus]SNR54196.1 Por secretion system C-terminal sorting domain-containing protein [Lutibacter flavus]
MKFIFNKLIILFLFFTIQFLSVSAQETNNLWTKKRELIQEPSLIVEKKSIPKEFKVFDLNIAKLKKSLNNIPKRKSNLKKSNVILQFPNGEGELEKYEIFEASILEESLQKKYPNIRSYVGNGIENSTSSIRFSITDLGLNAMVFQNSKETAFIETYTKNKESYLVYKKSDLPAETEPFECKFEDLKSNLTGTNSNTSSKANNANDGQLRTFRLAVATTGEYSQFHLDQQGIDPTATDEVKKSAVLSAIATTMTHVNAIFERDVALTMILVDNNASIIYLNKDTDGFTNDSSSDLIEESQTVINSVIGSSNYDIGHTFSTGGGGLAQLNSPCTPNGKARGITGSPNPIGPGYDIDYVAHEMGHQYGAHHTFNSEAGNCSGNINYGTAVETGSGSTIMAYSGLCAPDNVVSLSDDYFHLVSIREMWANISNGISTCGILTATGNSAPIINPVQNYTIPISTPFALTADASDIDGDLLTYTWEQLDTESATYPLTATSNVGPAFRSIKPSENPTRYFPSTETVLSGNTSNDWEVLPSVSRTMKFGLTVRDNNENGGQTASDESVITFDANSGSFMLTSQTAAESWSAGTANTITWNVANTNIAPVNCSNVNILLSTDGGDTYPIVLASNVPNDGSQEIIVPNETTRRARIKVESVGNVFYNVNLADIEIQSSEFIMDFDSNNLNICAPNNAIYTFTYNTFSNFNEETTFSALGFPEGATVTFNPATATDNNTTVEMVVSGIENTTATGLYNISVKGTSSSIEKNTVSFLNIFSSQFTQPILSSPENDSSELIDPIFLSWVIDENVIDYEIEISPDNSFSTIIESATLKTNNYSPLQLELNTNYFWRVKGKNECGESDFSTVYNFTTANIVCDSFNAIDIPVEIPDNNVSGASSVINITHNKIITDVNLTINIPHQWVGDLTLTLVSPNGTSVLLSANNGDEGLGYTNTIFDDDAISTIGSGLAPFTGTYSPQGNLSSFNTEESYGEWILEVVDSGPEDIGTIENWSIEICGLDVISEDDDKDGVPNNLDLCPNTPLGSTVDSSGCPIFSLAGDNFSIQTISETCPNENNGQILITAIETFDYVATINGTNYNFTNNSLTVDNLSPNSYDICITISGEDYEQCFQVEIAEGITISGKANNDSGKISVNIEQGTAPYSIFVNDIKTSETLSPTFVINAKHGDIIQVKTSVSCEGVFSKTVDSFSEILAYPNPSNGNYTIALPISQKEVTIEIYNIQSQLISIKNYNVVSGKVRININNNATGLYFVKVNLDVPVLLKVIKE